MPTYIYECPNHNEFEVQQSIKDEPLTECPLCKENGNSGVSIKRLIGKSSFILNGNGWAKDNYSK